MDEVMSFIAKKMKDNHESTKIGKHEKEERCSILDAGYWRKKQYPSTSFLKAKPQIRNIFEKEKIIASLYKASAGKHESRKARNVFFVFSLFRVFVIFFSFPCRFIRIRS